MSDKRHKINPNPDNKTSDNLYQNHSDKLAREKKKNLNYSKQGNRENKMKSLHENILNIENDLNKNITIESIVKLTEYLKV